MLSDLLFPQRPVGVLLRNIMNKPKLIIASAYAAILNTIVVVSITMWAELSPELKQWLTNFSGHHWTTKSIFSLLVYALTTGLLFFLPGSKHTVQIKRALTSLIGATALGVIILTTFFTAHHFGKI